MNSKRLQYSETANSVIEIPAPPRKHSFAALARTVVNWITSSNLDRAQAHFEIRRERAAQAEARRDLVNSLPLAEKHRFGMYRFMD